MTILLIRYRRAGGAATSVAHTAQRVPATIQDGGRIGDEISTESPNPCRPITEQGLYGTGETIYPVNRRCEEKLRRLETIPGVGRRTAEILAAEIGLDMSRFPNASHLGSWAGMCPGNYESAGKRKNGPMRLGNRALCRALVEAAHAAARTTKAD